MAGTNELLARQIAVLRRCASGGPQRFTALAGLLQVPPSTLGRLLRALVGAELVQVVGDGAYALGPGATALGLELLDRPRSTPAAEAAVGALADQTGASAAYWVLEGRRLILLAKREIADGFHYIDRFASRSPESSVFGLAVIAALPPPARARHLRQLLPAARRLLAAAPRGQVLAACLPPEPSWRVAAAVIGEHAGAGVVGLSRHGRPDEATDRRDRRCVQAAALRIAAGR